MMCRSLVAMLTLSLGLAACGDDTPTQPNVSRDGIPSAPQLAVTSNTWIARANMWGAERWNLAATTMTNAAGQSILYAIGGRSAAGGPLGKVMAYNVSTNTWNEKASLPWPLYGTSGAAVLNGRIYIAGGCSSVWCDGPSSALFMYDPALNTWTRKKDLPKPPYDPDNPSKPFPAGGGVSGVIAGKLYVVSQCWYVMAPSWYNCDPSFFSRYNAFTNSWTSLPRPSAIYSVGGVIGGRFYVAGQVYDPATGQRKPRVEVYDPATNRWTIKAPLATPLGNFGAVMLGKLYTISGTQLRVYDPSTNSVTTKASLPTNRGNVAAARVFLNGQPLLHVVGGTRPGNNLQYRP
jgi:hypothetical protein